MKDWLIANRLITMQFTMWNIQKDIIAGELDTIEADKLSGNIQYILHRIRTAKPFRLLNLEKEKARCEVLFSLESIKRINNLLRERALYILDDNKYTRPNTDKLHYLENEQAHFDDFLTTLNYYYNIGDDMNAAKNLGEVFIKNVASLEKRDTSHLIRYALECIKKVSIRHDLKPFQNIVSSDTEYFAMPKKPNSPNFVISRGMTFTGFMDFLKADFFEGINVGHYPKLCENCGRYYLKTNGRAQKYCTRIDPNDSAKRTCQAVAAAKGRAAKEPHPLKYPYETRMKTIRTHVKRGKITEKQAEAAALVAKNCYNKAIYEYDYAQTDYIKEIGQEFIYKKAGIKL
jgi:hypothetical protein